MSNLTLKQIEKMSMYLSQQELEKALSKALDGQQQVINTSPIAPLDTTPKKAKELTLDEALVEGGLFTWKLGDRNVRCSILTPQDMQLLDNISNDVEQGVEYKDLPVKYRYHVKTALGNYLFIKAKSYEEAQQVSDSIYSKGIYKVSASTL